MLTLALDATYAADPSPTGVGIYSQRLISSLRALMDRDSSESRWMLCFRPGPYLRARNMHWPSGCSLSPLLKWWPRPRQITLFHGLNQRLTNTRYPAQVVTVHDLFPLTSAEYSKPEFQSFFTGVLRHAVQRADRIIAVSDATRRELLRHTDAADAKIRVVHHGVDPPDIPTPEECDFFRSRVLRLNQGERFVLNVGTIQVRKNIANIALALRTVPDVRLVLAGGEGYGAEQILALIAREGLQDRVIHLGHTPKEQLRLLYSTAAALVFPSLEEGFGFPILEAMSYGLPVITSNCSSMPEVAGDAALLVDPRDMTQIADAMRRVTQDAALAEDLRNRGRKRATLFAWQKCAEQTWSVYQEVFAPGC